jgi:2-hydroxy-3-oxopropionate reductase
MSERIALIGAGAMGGAIGRRLLETGNSLTVFDLDTAKVDELVALGAVAAASAADASRNAEFVITSLNASRIVEIAAFGQDGIAEGAKPGTLIIDMSSIEPDATRRFAQMG